jgi:IS30 family transposase
MKECNTKLTLLIKEKWSPEQVSGHLKQESKKSLRHEAIYRFLVTDKMADAVIGKGQSGSYQLF